MVIEALSNYYGVECLRNVTIDHELNILEWGNDFNKPSKSLIKEIINNYKNTELKRSKIKLIAAEKINSIAPLYKQLNMVREDPNNSIFSRIDAVRFHSNNLEALIDNGEDVDINSGWPE